MSRKRIQAPDARNPNFQQLAAQWMRTADGLDRSGDDERRPTVGEVMELISKSSSGSSATGSGASSGAEGQFNPTKPSGVGAVWNENAGCVVVSWDIPSYSGHVRTEVRVSTTGSVNDSVTVQKVDGNQYLDFSGSAGQERTYYLRHIASDGNLSTFSSGIAATPQDISVDTPSTPANVLAYWMIPARGTLVKWDAPTYSGHLRTEVWVSTTGNINDATLKFVADDTQIVDYEYTYGVERFYHVRHMGEGGNGAYASDSATPTESLHNVMVSGQITNTTEIDIPVDLTGASDPKVLISVSGFYQSSVEWNGSSLDAEDGNAVEVIMKRGATALGTATPVKVQTSLTGTNGEKQYLHSLTFDYVNTPSSGSHTYHLQASRIFPGNTDSFTLNYSVTALRD